MPICKIALASALILTVFLSFHSETAEASDSANWDEGFEVPINGRNNPYNLAPEEYQTFVNQGKIHTQIYPVSVSGLIPPYDPVLRFLDTETDNPLLIALRKIFTATTGKTNLDDILGWVGLAKYPAITDSGIYQVPRPTTQKLPSRLGFGLIEKDGTTGFSISCAACHAGSLFGKTVLGMTNRFPGANHAFVSLKGLAPYADSTIFKIFNTATPGENRLFERAIKNLKAVAVRDPLLPGLDTSLSQVSLSLAKRNPDSWASKNDFLEAHPRYDRLQDVPADSKPAVWWNLKYKNRWLSDGSIVSGNPVFTNILWNEIGRGVDLHELDQWLSSNSKIIEELTTAVFSIEAPKYTDFFPAEKINLEAAKRGEVLFNQSCTQCHGQYQKAWSQPDSESFSAKDRLQTLQVNYKRHTPVFDVGTDRFRSQGMASLVALNKLEISQRNQTLVKTQVGYVPPPLVGIWARWPYLHNNSVPDLCSLLTSARNRPVTYYAGEAINPNSDFDSQCNGYPKGAKAPSAWKTNNRLYDTRRKGLGNVGHDEGIVSRNGVDIFSQEQKLDLIQFLQTL